MKFVKGIGGPLSAHKRFTGLWPTPCDSRLFDVGWCQGCGPWRRSSRRSRPQKGKTSSARALCSVALFLRKTKSIEADTKETFSHSAGTARALLLRCLLYSRRFQGLAGQTVRCARALCEKSAVFHPRAPRTAEPYCLCPFRDSELGRGHVL